MFSRIIHVAESGSGADIHKTGTNRQGIVWRGVQRYRQSNATSRGHKNNRFRRGGR